MAQEIVVFFPQYSVPMTCLRGKQENGKNMFCDDDLKPNRKTYILLRNNVFVLLLCAESKNEQGN